MDIEDVKVRLSEEGYCIFPQVLEAEEAQRLEHICRERIEARNVRRGHATGGGEQYISLECALNVVPELAPLCIHPIVMEIAEAVLGEGFILANNLAVRWAKPGTEAGALHPDWALLAAAWSWTLVSSPTPAWGGLQAFWMLSDGSVENGATRIVPFSHHTRRGPTRPSYASEVSVVGERGSLFVYHNGLWHAISANTTTDQHRVFANAFYTPKFVHRPRRIWPLVKREVYDTFSPRLQELLARCVENGDE
jgi:ectoine hydroxylase-related dioxygenase (phytanoyl-CoA dioxygenase family)